MTVYRIDCEWDMGFKELYPTKEAAQKDIAAADWSEVFDEPDDSIEKLIEEGYISIKEIEV